MTQDDIERVYDDFLYDCYIANKRLTPEDWEWYGKEEHHVDTPARDEGKLTPLNSQDLTQYQHWCAGVLQSEVKQKMCFAFVPLEVLPEWMEDIRCKWNKIQGQQSGVKGDKEGKRRSGEEARDSGRLETARSKRDPDKLKEVSAENLKKAQEYWNNLDPEEISLKRAKARGTKPFILVTPEGEKEKHQVISQAERKHKINNLSKVLRGLYPQTKGYTAYYEHTETK
jgi:hypothetical protein